MIAPILQPGAWTPGRFWTVTLFLFILQVGLIWTSAERERKPSALPAPDFAVRLLGRPAEQDQLATALFAADPTLFQAPSRRGFSGRAWMMTSSPEYHAGEADAPGVWLSLNAGDWKPESLSTTPQDEATLALAPPPATEFEPEAMFLDPDPSPESSAVRIEGGLARRPLAAPVTHLPAQPGVQLLGDTIVQMAVDSAGQVVSARLIGNSGSLAADATALAVARTLRFEPGLDPRMAAAWGEAVFSWQTVEPPGAAAK
jgi:TonB family protein